MKYKVMITETLSRIIEIEAKDKADALSTVKCEYNDENIILSSEDYEATEFDIISE